MNEDNVNGEFESYFGRCPRCGADPVLMNVGRVHFMVCRPCRVAWYVGDNLFSGWRREGPKVWRANREFLDTCQPVTPRPM
jgi:hypothetical protein